jgi:Domain of unknown function (DUF4340)
MKKIVILLLVLIAIAIATYIALQPSKGMNTNADISIKDTSDVAKLFLSDMQGHKIIITKTKENWLLNDSLVARKDGVQSILETLSRIKPMQPVPASAHNNIVNQLSATGVKVELFDAENKVLTSFTIGGSNNDGTGNYIYKKDCDRPYIYKKGGFIGDLSSAFFTDLDEWKSREIIKNNPNEIEKISVYYAQNKDSSFYIEQSKSEVKMGYDNGTPIVFSNTKIKDYLKEFSSQYCTSYENRLLTKDSIIKQGEPYGHIAIKTIGKPMDTLHLVFFKANQKASSVREINGRYFDQEFLLAYSKKDLSVVPTSSFSKLLARPGYFAK